MMWPKEKISTIFNQKYSSKLYSKKIVAIEPTRFPNDPANITPVNPIFPVAARKPEKGIIISLGIGMSALSSIISINIPPYPRAAMIEVINCTNGSSTPINVIVDL